MFEFATKFAPRKRKIRKAWDAGFRAAEIRLDKKCLKYVDKVIKTTSGFDFKYVIHFPNRENLTGRQLKAFVQLYRALDCQVAVIHPPMLESYEKRLQNIASGSLTLAVENGRNSLTRFQKWADQNEYLTLDAEHLWKFTLGDCPFQQFEEFLDQFIAQYGPKIRHIHMPGYIPGSAEHCPAYTNPQFATLVWDKLKEVNYRGFAVSELDRKFQTDTHLERDIVLFEKWKEGLKVADPGSVIAHPPIHR